MPDIVYKGRGGLNEDTDNARSDQVIEAANVWMPNGRIEQRPGFVGVGAFDDNLVTPNGRVVTEDVSAGLITETLVFGGLEEGDRIYFLMPVSATAYTFGLFLHVNTYNTNAVGYRMEYWNGSEWVYGSSYEVENYGTTEKQASQYFMQDGGGAVFQHLMTFPEPADITSYTITTTAGVAITGVGYRIVLTNKGMAFPATLSAGTAINSAARLLSRSPKTATVARPLTGMFRFDTLSGRFYFYSLSDSSANGMDGLCVSRSAHGLSIDNNYLRFMNHISATCVLPAWDRSVTTLAPVPQEDKAYATVHGKILELDISAPILITGPIPPVYAGQIIEAEVESRESFVGPGAIADRETLAQLTAFPPAHCVRFFGNRLWALDGHRVRWSLASPAHRVWPSDAFADLMENDNSETVTAEPLGEHLVVYKQDSIWLMVFSQIDDFGVPHFTPVQVVRGVGCVAPNSVQTINGKHVFLSENGIFAFDGTPNIRKISLDRYTGSDRLVKTIGSISMGSRFAAASCHWAKRSTYMLSVACNGQTGNETTIVWQYDRDVFWIWSGLDANSWMVDESSHDEEEIYFGDKYGRIYKFGVGTTNHGGEIAASVTFPYIGRDDGVNKLLSAAEVFSSNDSAPLTVSVIVNDGASSQSAYSFDSAFEGKYGTAVYGTSKYVGRRQRFLKRDWNVRGDFYQLKVAKQAGYKSRPVEIASVRAEIIPVSRR